MIEKIKAYLATFIAERVLKLCKLNDLSGVLLLRERRTCIERMFQEVRTRSSMPLFVGVALGEQTDYQEHNAVVEQVRFEMNLLRVQESVYCN